MLGGVCAALLAAVDAQRAGQLGLRFRQWLQLNILAYWLRRSWHAPSARRWDARAARAMTSQLRLPTAVAARDPATACAEIDLAAFRANVATLQSHAGVPAMVVKADGYGHGSGVRS